MFSGVCFFVFAVYRKYFLSFVEAFFRFFIIRGSVVLVFAGSWKRSCPDVLLYTSATRPVPGFATPTAHVLCSPSHRPDCAVDRASVLEHGRQPVDEAPL